jgi:nicotinamidase-related amidase
MSKGIEERKFLHDIASPIATAIFLIDMIKDGVKDLGGIDADVPTQVKQLEDLLEKIRMLVEERREVLIKQGVPSSKAS